MMNSNSKGTKDGNFCNYANCLCDDSERFVPLFDQDDSMSNMKWNGWGFEDSKFVISENGSLVMTGNRYSINGKLPYLREFVENEMQISLTEQSPSREIPTEFPEPIINKQFIGNIACKFTLDNLERLTHSHGQSVQEIWCLRNGSLPRLVDAVIYPSSHKQIESIVKLANENNVTVIPYGGGTNVSRDLECPATENRMIVSLDMRAMNKILWIDTKNMVVCVEAGISGQQLSNRLLKYNLTVGHEPDSLEFSTLGGWISTRASGMKKNLYGNIEDLLVDLTIVTPIGTWSRNSLFPRVSSGPDILQIFLGHEGIYGVVTQAVIKVCNLPPVKKYGSMLFPTFEKGIEFMHCIAKKKIQPASLRLVDPEQFRFGQALKPAPESWFEIAKNRAKKFYILNIKRFDPAQICAATVVFEGSVEKVRLQENSVFSTARDFGAVIADEKSGYTGYALTFAIAYLRDLGMDLNFIAESFETSVPWSMTCTLCKRVKKRIHSASKQIGITSKPFVSCRVTQVYDVGSCVYFYFGFNYLSIENPIDKFNFVENAARDEILLCGGSISHHHGVGKQRKYYIENSIGQIGVKILSAIKNLVDPNNVFACNNIFDKI